MRDFSCFPKSLALFAALFACTLSARAAPAPSPRGEAPLPPIVIVPGAPATELVDSRTGRRLWPNAWLMGIVVNGNGRLALPLDDPESSPVVAGPLLREIHVLGMKFPIHTYDGLEAGLRAMGYRAGDLRSPAGAGEYYFFPYDWRQSVETSGRRFFRGLTELYRRMPPETPPAVVLGHSLGGLVSRYALMYGDAPLGTSGPLPAVTWAGSPYIDTLFLIATPNEGSFTALKCLEEGTFYALGHGAFSPGTLFTFRSVFDMLPAQIEPLIDPDGKPLPFRLDEAADWAHLGWSVIDRRGKSGRSAAAQASLRAHLERELARHKRLKAAMAQVADTPNPVDLLAIGSLAQTVQRTALVMSQGNRIKSRFVPPAGKRKDLMALLFEPGDTMIPFRSLTADSSTHDPASSLFFRSVIRSPRLHQGLLSSPEMLSALDRVVQEARSATARAEATGATVTAAAGTAQE
jgi:Lecithin:cholesterol acyltransferase